MTTREYTRIAFTNKPTEQLQSLVSHVFRDGFKISDNAKIQELQIGDVLIPAPIAGELFSRAVVVDNLTDTIAGFDPDESCLNNPMYKYTISSKTNQYALYDAPSIRDAVSLRTVFHTTYGFVRQAAVKRFGEFTWVNLPNHAHIVVCEQ